MFLILCWFISNNVFLIHSGPKDPYGGNRPTLQYVMMGYYS
jgi:hypothetical protein